MKRELREIISKDIFRYYGQERIPIIEKVLPYSLGLKYIILYRKANYYYNRSGLKKYWYQWHLKRMSMKYGYQIHPATKIGEGFYMGHIAAIIVNPSSQIGKNVSLAQGVTIGAHVRGEKKGTPIIGDEVYIGANAVVVGKISIGNDVVIAPNTFVNFDVPAHSIVMGNPGKSTHRENATEGFIVYKV